MPRGIYKIRNSEGYKHHSWKGDKATYFSQHDWIRYHYGKANKCENKNCKNKCKYFEWANISGVYIRDISDYKKLCIVCHKEMDYFNKYGNKCMKGHEFTPENTYIFPSTNKRRCMACRKEGNDYIPNRRKILGRKS